jgi:hypothetical protein
MISLQAFQEYDGLYDQDPDFSRTRNTMFNRSVSVFQEPHVSTATADVRPPMETYAAENRKAPLAPQNIALGQGTVRPGDAAVPVPGV